MLRTISWASGLVLVLACGGGGSSGPTEDPTQLTQPLAQNISISEIAILQALKVPVMKNGSVADRGDIPLVALRDSILRVYVNPGSAYQPHALTARARLVTQSPMGSTAQVFAATATISGESQESDLTTTINIPIPGAALDYGTAVTVVINDKTGDPATSTTSNAQWPQDGTLSDLAVRGGGDHVRVMIVPMQYNADGSGRLPDTSDAQIEAYRRHFYQLYPTAEVDITVHDPWPYSGAINGFDATTLNTALMALGKVRSADQPDSDVYYYGAFQPTDDFGSYCGGGCVTGLSPIGGSFSVGIGYTDLQSGANTSETAVHEVGHAHGRYHAPCGGAASPDPMYPYPGALIGVWGYDPFAKVMIDPTVTTDMMSYCAPTWISDYHYGLIFTRVRYDNGYYYADWQKGAGTPDATKKFSLAPVSEKGDVRISDTVMRDRWITLGEPRTVTWEGGTSTAYYFPLDHMPGGILYVGDEVPALASVAGLRPIEPVTSIAR